MICRGFLQCFFLRSAEFFGDQAEAVELTAGVSAEYSDVPLKKLNIAKGVLVAAIVRRNEIIIPHGSDVIKPGDNVILIAKDKKITDLDNTIGSGE